LEAPSRNHSCTGKAVSITFSECVFVALVIQNAKRVRRILLSSVACLVVLLNRDLFLFNSEIHDINTRHKYNLHLPTGNLTLVQKGVLYSGSKIYNHLPLHIKTLSNDLKHFKSKMKSFLVEHTLYSLEEFYQVTSK
jgi:hypothetical protein